MNTVSFKHRLQQTLNPLVLFLLNSLFVLVRVFAEGWRWWVGMAVVGSVLLAGYGWLQPLRFRSEGTLTITPRYLLEGYMLATQELTRHYAVRLAGDERIARSMVAARTEIEPLVTAISLPGMVIALTVEHPNAAVSESLTRALLVDLRDEISMENRTRIENDRLTIVLSPTSFAQQVTPSLQWYGVVGALGGFGLGLLWVFGAAFRRRGRLRSEAEARQAVGLPALGIIPKR